MTIKFFTGVKTRHELKKKYVELLRLHHPDNGGDVEVCKVLNTEYEYLAARLPQTFEEGHEMSEKEKKADFDLDKTIRDLLARIIHMEGANIEVVGIWIWIDGNTYPYKEELKEYGFTWSRARKKWHCCPYGEGKWYKGPRKDFDTIRSLYGSNHIPTDPRPSLT